MESERELRQVTLRLSREDRLDRLILNYLDDEVPHRGREKAVKRALVRYIQSRRRNRAKE